MTQAKKQGARPRTQAKTRRNRPIGLVILALLLFGVAWAMFDSDYSKPKEVFDTGVPGTYTLAGCRRGTTKSASTHCAGRFSSADGRIVGRRAYLINKHDAQGIEVGGHFPARLDTRVDTYMGDAIRTDGTGRTDLLMMGLAPAGLALMGLMVVGFAARAVWMPPDARGRSRLGLALGLVTAFGGLFYAVTYTLGAGLLA
jgi:hypothetical protein